MPEPRNGSGTRHDGQYTEERFQRAHTEVDQRMRLPKLTKLLIRDLREGGVDQETIDRILAIEDPNKRYEEASTVRDQRMTLPRLTQHLEGLLKNDEVRTKEEATAEPIETQSPTAVRSQSPTSRIRRWFRRLFR